MEQQLIEIREQQKASWNKFSPGWRKWDEMVTDSLRPMGDEIIRLIDPKGKDCVLDIASGSGEPGLTIATMLNGGKVIITDIADDMLAIARDNAAARGIKNVETVACDACDLPFADGSVDAVSCRMGFMFFPDMLLAAKEMARVLKPGGRIAISVWDVPQKNFWVTAAMSTLGKYMDIQPPPPGAPGLFRCAADGLMTGIFQQAGFSNISQREVKGRMSCKTADVYWRLITEVAAPVATALANADEETREKVRNDVFDLVHERYPEGSVMIDSGALVIYGEKPSS